MHRHGGRVRGPSGRRPTAAVSDPGRRALGDPYVPGAGNGGYDVGHYALNVRYDPADDRLTGTATITATATAALSRFHLDLAGLDVDRVRVDGEPATSAAGRRRAGRHARARAAGREARFTVEVAYGGVPRPLHRPALGDGGFLHTPDGAIALGQPESASTWFPVNDHPSDKATYDVAVTVPDGLAALAQRRARRDGRPPAAGPPGAGRSGSPMASYLTTLVIGTTAVTTGTHDGQTDGHRRAGQPAGGRAGRRGRWPRTGEHRRLSWPARFGPYPFDAYGGIVVADDRIRYALETQTRPVYGPRLLRQGRPNDRAWSRTSWPTSGSATASRWTGGATSG